MLLYHLGVSFPLTLALSLGGERGINMGRGYVMIWFLFPPP